MPTSAFSNIFIKDSLIDSTFFKALMAFYFQIYRLRICNSLFCNNVYIQLITTVAPLLNLASISNRTLLY